MEIKHMIFQTILNRKYVRQIFSYLHHAISFIQTLFIWIFVMFYEFDIVVSQHTVLS
jgi:hypothetical protein